MTRLEVVLLGIRQDAKEREERARRDFRAGIADCKAGQFDKWYRKNRTDEGLAYEAGWLEANEEIQNENVRFIGE